MKCTYKRIWMLAVLVLISMLLIACSSPESTYKTAEELLAKGQYTEAAKKYESLGDYEDATNKAVYSAARASFDAGDYQGAQASFEALGSFGNSADYAAYSKARNLETANEQKALEEAKGLYQQIPDFLDSSERALALGQRIKEEFGFSGANIGDYITYGTYEQDNVLGNGAEPIEWLVLAKEEDRLLVISRYALDAKPFHERYEEATWDTCTLRTWLNGDFLSSFTAEEMAAIPVVTVPARGNPEYAGAPVGMDTQDRVFLLSSEELWQYFAPDLIAPCEPTSFAVSRGAGLQGMATCTWWLRTSGVGIQSVYVDYDGYVVNYGYALESKYVAVRPAMWLNIDE